MAIEPSPKDDQNQVKRPLPDLGTRSEHISIEHDPDDLWSESRVIVNIGPTHPAMHGALRMAAKLNGKGKAGE